MAKCYWNEPTHCISTAKTQSEYLVLSRLALQASFFMVLSLHHAVRSIVYVGLGLSLAHVGLLQHGCSIARWMHYYQ